MIFARFCGLGNISHPSEPYLID